MIPRQWKVIQTVREKFSGMREDHPAAGHLPRNPAGRCCRGIGSPARSLWPRPREQRGTVPPNAEDARPSRPRTSPCSQGLQSAPSDADDPSHSNQISSRRIVHCAASAKAAPKPHHRSCPCRSPSAQSGTDRASAAAQTGWLPRIDTLRQRGQGRASVPDRAVMTITPSFSAMASTTHPAGIKDDKRKFLTMVLIPPAETSTTPPCKFIKCESDPLLRERLGSPIS